MPIGSNGKGILPNDMLLAQKLLENFLAKRVQIKSNSIRRFANRRFPVENATIGGV